MNPILISPDLPTFEVEIAVGGILFDMDGVLVSSTAGDELCWTTWSARHNLGHVFNLRKTHGRRTADTVREYFPKLDDLGIADHIAELDTLCDGEHGGVAAYPGARDLLALLPPYRWTIVTSATDRIMRRSLATVGIVAPRHTVGGDSLAYGKPHPEGYLRGAAMLSRRPEECLVIEDAPAGIRAGKAAGCQVLAIASSHQPGELSEADWIIDSIAQIKLSIGDSNLNLNFSARKQGC